MASEARRSRGALLHAKRTRQAVLVWCFLVPSLAIFFLYRVLPLGWNVWLSFQEWSPMRPAEFAGLYHYEEMLIYDDVFWQALWNTLIFIASGPIGIVLALGIALLVNAEIRGREIYRTIVFLSYPLMTVAVGFIWRWLYDERVGLFNYVLRGTGLIDEPIAFLQTFEWSLPAVILANIWQMLGFYMIVLLTGLQSIPHNLYEAAAIDGAPRWAQLWRITLPMISPAILFVTIIGVIGSFQTFTQSYIMTGGGPANSTLFYLLYLYKNAFNWFEMGYASALAWVLFLVIIVCTVLLLRTSARWVYYEGGTEQRH